MKCFSSKFLAVVTAVAIVAMAAQLAVAQNDQGKGGRGRGRGGPGGMGGPPSMARLAMLPKVQEALKLTDDEKTKIEKINADFRKEMSGDRPDPEKMKQMRDEVNDKLMKALDADQQKRLMGIFVQLMGAGSVMDPAVGKEIGLTDEQKDKLHEAIGPPPEGGREARGAGGGQSFADRRAKMEKDVMAVLTPDQQKKLESLKGEKVDIDMSALRGAGGGQGRGRGRGKNADSDSSSK
jgi:Spy/CpxP family protein refolding chaperone